MALSISCSLSLPPPTSTSTSESLQPKTSHLGWNLNHQKERSWKSRCLLGVATVIIGLEMNNLVVGEQEMALARDLQQQQQQQRVASRSVQIRWSDKRKCPPWHVNSLETIVPENLPRPSFPRRWEAVGFPDESTHEAAQSAPIPVAGPKKCFSL